MLKVCIDTNIWISGLLYSGPPAEIVNRALKKRLQVVASDAILSELEKNLTGKFGLKPRTFRFQ